MPDRIWIQTNCFAKPLPLHWLIQQTARDPHWAGLSQRFRSRAPVVLLSLDRVRSVPRVPTDPLPWRSPSRTPSNRKNRNVFPVRATRLGTDPPPFIAGLPSSRCRWVPPQGPLRMSFLPWAPVRKLLMGSRSDRPPHFHAASFNASGRCHPHRSGSASRHGVGTGFAGIVGRQTMERGSAGNITDLLLRREPPRFARSTRD